MTRRVLLLDHALPLVASGSDEEFHARVRVQLQDPERGLRSLRSFGEAGTLGHLRGASTLEAFPAVIEELVSEIEPHEPELEVRVPSEIQTWIQRKAPRTWSLLLENTQLLQRGEAYVLERTATQLEITRRPEGVLRAEDLTCPLLQLCDSLSRDRIPGVSGVVAKSQQLEPAIRLIRQVLVSRWLTRRLGPGLIWHGPTQSYRLRSHPDLPRLTEGGQAAEPGAPAHLSLELAGTVQPFELDVDPHDDLPLAVVRRGISWLLDPSRTAETIFLDRRGKRPSERAEDRDQEALDVPSHAGSVDPESSPAPPLEESAEG